MNATLSPVLSPKELKAALDRGERFQLIDVRTPEEYAEGHVPCAVNLPVDQVASRLDDLTRPDPVVLICHSGMRAEMACATLRATRQDVHKLDGGTAAWIAAGLPVIGNRAKGLPLQRQVQLTAGALALTGAVLGATVAPAWYGLSAFIGAGLMFAGATGMCPLASAVKQMPWNR